MAMISAGARTLNPFLRKRQPTFLSQRAALRRGPVHVAASIAVAHQYGYVIASTAFTAAVLQWQAIRVAIARRKYNVAYPKMYAEGEGEEAQIFNCTQRSHQNTLETAPAMLVMTCMLGLVYPVSAAILNAVWSVGRIFYATGYSTGDPSKRMTGAGISGLSYLGCIIATLVVGLRTALAA
ncbi:hypothetical protein MNEG_6530 [Monoraphidium neglectum]|uniref:Glutathione S-transferase 3, mitochondrial n=1 Tax=Monoraphidium neglectum TaxID=145388 RepID=A0A0D2JQQ3_9CHLO|nr:hypothetical protein MNEG_6530 [Monoraphidium neglectum]KIZ01433.1 hypothetical protein MNEG_6530 [Monoraphidium neglectum]|eukprot:XP_013900452.1 hypothetical protein MNEG_6530 [Monoraphidium neglectum]